MPKIIVHREEGSQFLHRPLKLFRPCVLYGHPCFPVVYDRIHHHIKYGEEHMVALCDPPGLCEQGDVAEPCHGYHGDYLSVLS